MSPRDPTIINVGRGGAKPYNYDGPSCQLWYSGRLWPEPARCAVIIGRRAASSADEHAAFELAKDVSRRGIGVLSAGSVGVDHAAHEGALACGGYTAAVLARPLFSPGRQQKLYRRILENGGGLLSLCQPGGAVMRRYFAKRAQVLPRLANAVLIVAADISSGALVVARNARKSGIMVGAVPGSPGTDSLLAEGAALVDCADDMTAALADNARHAAVAPPKWDSLEGEVFTLVKDHDGAHIDQVLAATGEHRREVIAAITALELSGLIFRRDTQLTITAAARLIEKGSL